MSTVFEAKQSTDNIILDTFNGAYDESSQELDVPPRFNLEVPLKSGVENFLLASGKEVQIRRNGELRFTGVIETPNAEEGSGTSKLRVDGMHLGYKLLQAKQCDHYYFDEDNLTVGTRDSVFVNPWNYIVFRKPDGALNIYGNTMALDGVRPDEVEKCLIGTRFIVQKDLTDNSLFLPSQIYTKTGGLQVYRDGPSADKRPSLQRVRISDGTVYSNPAQIETVALENGDINVDPMGDIASVTVTFIGVDLGSDTLIASVCRNARLANGNNNTSRTYSALSFTKTANYLGSGLTHWTATHTFSGSETVKNSLAVKLTYTDISTTASTKLYYAKFDCVTASDTGLSNGTFDSYAPDDIIGLSASEKTWVATNLQGMVRLDAAELVRKLTVSPLATNSSPHYDAWIDGALLFHFKARRGAVIANHPYTFSARNLKVIGHERYGGEIAYQTIAYGPGSGNAQTRIVTKEPFTNNPGGLYDSDRDPTIASTLGAGSALLGGAGHGTDVTGGGRDLTLGGSPADRASPWAKYGTGINLDGANDDASSANSAFNHTGDLSYTWVGTVDALPSGTAPDGWVFGATATGPTSQIFPWALEATSSGSIGYFHSYSAGVSAVGLVSAGGVIVAGQSYRISLTRNVATRTVVIKVNGVEVVNTTYASGAPATIDAATTPSFNIGRDIIGSGGIGFGYNDGAVYEARFWNSLVAQATLDKVLDPNDNDYYAKRVGTETAAWFMAGEVAPSGTGALYGKNARILNFIDQNEKSVVALLSKARAFHKLHRNPIESVRVELIAEHIRYFDMGDSIRITNIKTRTNAEMRVVALRREWSGGAREKLTVVLGEPSTDFASSMANQQQGTETLTLRPQPTDTGTGLSGNGFFFDKTKYAVVPITISDGASVDKVFLNLTTVPWQISARGALSSTHTHPLTDFSGATALQTMGGNAALGGAGGSNTLSALTSTNHDFDFTDVALNSIEGYIVTARLTASENDTIFGVKVSSFYDTSNQVDHYITHASNLDNGEFVEIALYVPAAIGLGASRTNLSFVRMQVTERADIEASYTWTLNITTVPRHTHGTGSIAVGAGGAHTHPIQFGIWQFDGENGNGDGAAVYGTGIQIAIDPPTVNANGIPTNFTNERCPFVFGKKDAPQTVEFEITGYLTTEANGIITNGVHRVYLLGAQGDTSGAYQNVPGLGCVSAAYYLKMKQVGK